MSFDLQRMLESKRALRQKLAARPVAEKLRLLDELRAAALAIRRAAGPAPATPGLVSEDKSDYRAEGRK